MPKRAKAQLAPVDSAKTLISSLSPQVAVFVEKRMADTGSADRIAAIAEQMLPNEKLRRAWMADSDLKNHVPQFPLVTIADLDRWIAETFDEAEEYRDHEHPDWKKLFTWGMERAISGAKIWLRAHGLWRASDPRLKESPRRHNFQNQPIGEERYVELLDEYVSSIRDVVDELDGNQGFRSQAHSVALKPDDIQALSASSAVRTENKQVANNAKTPPILSDAEMIEFQKLNGNNYQTRIVDYLRSKHRPIRTLDLATLWNKATPQDATVLKACNLLGTALLKPAISKQFGLTLESESGTIQLKRNVATV